MRRVEYKIIIKADIYKVWQAIVLTKHYPAWNPFIIAVDPTLDAPVVGTEMEFTVRWKDGATRKTTEVVNSFSPPEKIDAELKGEWGYYFKSFMRTIGMVRATRKQVIVSTQEGTTLYHTYEDFKGWGVLFLPMADIKDGFERQSLALKQYCEQNL